MPQSQAEIKHAPVSSESWRDNRTSILWFDPRQIRPLGDHILVELESESMQVEYVTSVILRPDICLNRELGTRAGVVLAVGPGKWTEKPGLSWELTKQVFKPATLKPGDIVLIGHYSDWESWNAGADGFEGQDNNIVLCQEGDVRLYRRPRST